MAGTVEQEAVEIRRAAGCTMRPEFAFNPRRAEPRPLSPDASGLSLVIVLLDSIPATAWDIYLPELTAWLAGLRRGTLLRNLGVPEMTSFRRSKMTPFHHSKMQRAYVPCAP